jgi:uncharacterized protein YggE
MFDEKFKKIIGVFAVVLALYVMILTYNEFLKSKYTGKEFAPTSTISVNATGEVFAKPDIATVSLSVVKEARAVVDAQKQNTEAINKITKFLKDSGVEDKDLKTTGYNIYPLYDYLEKQGRVFKGYEVRQSLEVKIRKIDEAGKILSGAAEAGANEVSGLSFKIDDEEALKRVARKQAIDKAKEKAEQLAKDLNIDLLRLVNFSESGDMPMYMTAKAEGIGMGGSAPEIPTGENKISVTVNLTYEIR